MHLPRLRHVAFAAFVAAGMICLLALASRVVVPKNNQVEFGQADAPAFGVLGEPRDSIDVLFLGDSEAYCSFSPLQLWGEQGITSYVAATSAQRLPYTRSILLKALQNQRPRVVVLETNCLFRKTPTGFAAIRALSDIFPVFEYHSRWKSLRPEDFTSTPRATWTDPNKGYRLRTSVNAASAERSRTYMEPKGETATIPALNRWYLDDIARICRENGAQLVLVSTPSVKNWSLSRHACAEQVAAELDVSYIDFNMGSEHVDIDWERDTFDKGDHLNLYGAQKTTSAMGVLLRREFHVPSHAGDDAYRSWNDDYARYQKDVKKASWPNE